MSSVGPEVVQAGDILAVDDYAVDRKLVTAILSRAGPRTADRAHEE